ncbi:MAG TPA: N-acyl homoserine lactonase family protein [Gammaproteobacteria bacterium]|nr:N-acyl homoserine lactonase family protein [Gammaproteobacteria bacterium]
MRASRHQARSIGRIVAGGLAALAALASQAQTSADAPLRLYVLDGGTLVNPDPSWANLTLAEMQGYTSIPVPAYLVVHPNGVLLWDTGLSDALLGKPPEEAVRGPWTQIVTATLAAQLEEIGYTPEDVDYLALSHAHFDHAGNVSAFADATWIVQRAELDSVDFGDIGQWSHMSALRDSRRRIIEGDHDVFGDGRVVLKFTPGHTPGHQSLFLDLHETGPVVLSGDLYHLDAHRRLARIRLTDHDRAQSAASRAALDGFLAQTGAVLWIQHELMLWARLEHAPRFYD